MLIPLLAYFAYWFSHWSDPDYILLPPQRPSSTISESLLSKIVISLSTRFNKPQNTIRLHFTAENAEQWATVRRLEGGDDMHASHFTRHSEDQRDATYVRVSLFHIQLEIKWYI